MIHELKTWPVAFELTLSGAKMFEIRVNDRNFQIGHVLHLREWDHSTGEYTGRELSREVTCIVTGWGLPDGVCALGLKDAALRQAGGDLKNMAQSDEITRRAIELYYWLDDYVTKKAVIGLPKSTESVREIAQHIARSLAAQSNAPQAGAVRAVIEAAERKQETWLKLGKCQDEFSEYPGACGECVEMDDDAQIALNKALAALKGSE